MTYPPQGHYPPQQGGYPPQQQAPYPQSGGFPQQPPPQQPMYPQQGGFQQPSFQQPSFPPPNMPPPMPRKNTGGKIALGVVAAVIIGGVVWGFSIWGTGAAAAEEGDCIEVVNAESAEAKKADCGSKEAVYKVAKKLDSSSGACPKGNYTEWKRSGRTDTMKLCLMLNAKEGECFKLASGNSKESDARVACDSGATKVVKVVTGTADKSACGRGNVVAVYSEPATTLCMTKV